MSADAKICVVCSAGGHLTEALAAIAKVKQPWYLVTYPDRHVSGRVAGLDVEYVVNPHLNPVRYLQNAWQSLRVLLRRRPRVIIATGAGVAIATCLFGKVLGAKVIFVETGSRISTPSRTGRLLYPVADLFLIQSRALEACYPRAKFGGMLL